MSTQQEKGRLAIIGTGNLGRSIAEGLVKAGEYDSRDIILTRKHIELMKDLEEKGYRIERENSIAVREAEIIILAVRPMQVDGVMKEIGGMLDAERHMLISVVTDVTVEHLRSLMSQAVPVVRAMPNIAIAIRESMTCLAGRQGPALEKAKSLFEALGSTLVIEEEMMVPATVLGACGVAYFLRAIRAASQGGIQIGFHAEEALQIAAQTAKGAADLLLQKHEHPESAIDKVTTPRGCTIAGLNEMEHQGFSSSMIKGILTSFKQAENLYEGTD